MYLIYFVDAANVNVIFEFQTFNNLKKTIEMSNVKLKVKIVKEGSYFESIYTFLILHLVRLQGY